MMSLFEPIGPAPNTSVTNLKDLSSEFASTMACCEEGACC